MLDLALVVLATVTQASLGVFAAMLGGPLWRWVWRTVHGTDRSWLADGIACLVVASAVRFTITLHDAQMATWTKVLQLVCTVLVMGWILARPRGTAADVRAVEPDGVVRDHDGLVVALQYKPALVSLLVIASAWLAPLPMILGAAAWSRRGGLRARIRVRGDHIDVTTPFGRSVVPLAGATATRAAALDGGGVLRVSNGERRADLPIGGVAPGTVAWLRDVVDGAIATATTAPRIEDPPEDLRTLTSAARREVTVER